MGSLMMRFKQYSFHQILTSNGSMTCDKPSPINHKHCWMAQRNRGVHLMWQKGDLFLPGNGILHKTVIYVMFEFHQSPPSPLPSIWMSLRLFWAQKRFNMSERVRVMPRECECSTSSSLSYPNVLTPKVFLKSSSGEGPPSNRIIQRSREQIASPQRSTWKHQFAPCLNYTVWFSRFAMPSLAYSCFTSGQCRCSS